MLKLLWFVTFFRRIYSQGHMCIVYFCTVYLFHLYVTYLYMPVLWEVNALEKKWKMSFHCIRTLYGYCYVNK